MLTTASSQQLPLSNGQAARKACTARSVMLKGKNQFLITLQRCSVAVLQFKSKRRDSVAVVAVLQFKSKRTDPLCSRLNNHATNALKGQQL
jgi:hypothetical protein